jgi:dipeptidyl aminopeptidase/acylaminoacyl peptidase
MMYPRTMLLLPFAALFAFSAQAEKLTLEKMGQIVRLSDPQISPDSKSIAALVSRANFEENRYDAQLMLIDVASKAQRTLVRDRRGISSPRWSPDGKRLAFLAALEGRSQVFALPMDGGGEAVQLTAAPKAVQQFAWSPDGSRIAYVTEDEASKVTGPERHNKAFEVGHNDFLVTTAQLPSHLWMTPADGVGRAKRLTSGSWTLPKSMPPSSPSSPVNWSPDGKSILFVKVATPYTGDSDQSTIQIIDVESGAIRALTGRTRNESQPVISPDGKWVSYWHPREGNSKNVNEIQVAPFAGGEGRSLTRALDRNIQRAIWTSDSKAMIVSANDGTGVSIWNQPVAEGAAAKKFELGKIVPTAPFWLDASLALDGMLAFTASTPTRPAEIYLSKGSTPQRLTDFNGAFEALELGKTESIQWTGADGFKQDGVVTYPPGFDASKKYPLVLYIHGGPRSASKEIFGRAQLFASRGWVVFEPNYRGSDNLGNAFQAAIWNDAGAGPGRDVMSGVEVLKKRGWVDETRMAPTGWSYGGYMTTWLLGNYPDAWKTAVAGAAVTSWLDQYNLGDANVRRGASIGGSPWTDPKRMQAAHEQSPIHYATRIKAPTLILSNTGDYRVPVTQSYELYHALRDRGIPTQFIAYPLPGHSPADPVHSRDVDRRWIAWLEKYFGSNDGSASPQLSGSGR